MEALQHKEAIKMAVCMSLIKRMLRLSSLMAYV